MTDEKTLPQNSELIALIDNNGLEPITAESLKEAFIPFFEKVSEWKEKALQINVTSIDQRDDMKQAREGRLILKDIRVAAEKVRKSLKEDSLKKGKAIDAAYSLIENQIKPLESHLEQQEKFAEIQEAKRLAEVKTARLELLRPYNVAIDSNLIGLMSDEMFDNFLDGTKRKHDEAIEAARLAEVARLEAIETARLAQIERERIEAEQREAIRLENEKLKRELFEREVEAKRERERLEAERKERERIEAERLAAERAEKERIEKIEAERLEAELKERQRLAQIEAERLESERRAKAAPDKEKILAFAEMLAAIEVPVFENVDTASQVDFVKSEYLSKAIAKLRNFAREL
jgi:hypothetical protein